MLWHLDARRGELEAALVRAVVAQEPEDVARLAAIRRQLAELRAVREGYEAALSGGRHVTPVRPHSVCLSAAWADLQPYRHALQALLGHLQLHVVGMEAVDPSPEPPGVAIRRQVDEAAVYLGVLGMRYGAVDAVTGLSMSELEYRQAVASEKPLQMFVLDDQAPITVDMVETDPQQYARLRAFRDRVLQSHVCRRFAGVDDLIAKAERALRDLIGT
jgi:hypothetical protein